jgi:deoxyribose-phosphate aldolase
MNPAEFEALVARITDDLYARIGARMRGACDHVCSVCGGPIKRCGGSTMDDLFAAGASRIGSVPGVGRTAASVAALIDHTLLKADATEDQVDRLCDEAAEHGFASVCINPVFVPRCRRRLEGSGVRTCTVIGFPLGATFSDVKATEARRAQNEGAEELDMVLAVGLLKSGRADLVRADIEAVVATRAPGHVVKVILETCLLTDAEKRLACRLSVAVGADFVKTSTGFSTGGATVRDIVLMRAEVGPAVGIKASGGLKDLATVEEMVAAGANRIGASAGVRIVSESTDLEGGASR